MNYRNKPVIAMLHLMGCGEKDTLERMIREANQYYENGVDAVMVENYFGSAQDCEKALAWLAAHMPEKCYGLNILGDHRLAFALAEDYGAAFVQMDSVCGHLRPTKDEAFARRLAEQSQGRSFDILGGLRFKYQPVLSGRTLQEDAVQAMQRCDAVVTTGAGTGMNSPTEKLVAFRKVLGDFPLIVGAGTTADTVAEKLRYADGVIVGSWMKEEHNAYGEVCEAYVKTFMDKVREARKSGISKPEASQ